MPYNIFSMYYSFKMFRVFNVASIPRLINRNQPALSYHTRKYTNDTHPRFQTAARQPLTLAVYA